jgi:hypothetical protein
MIPEPEQPIGEGAHTPLALALKAGRTTLNGREYLNDAKGGFTPVEVVKAQDILEDETVRKVMFYAKELSAQIARFKANTFLDLNAFQSLLEQEYGARKGGTKGNVRYFSHDGLMMVQVQMAEQITFGPQLQVAKTLIDACLLEWGAESHEAIRALINRVFSVEKEGQINRGELFGLLRLEIKDERWQRAMEAVKDSIRSTGTKAYVRFYERSTHDGPLVGVRLDIASG